MSVTPSLDDIAKKLQALNTQRPFRLTFRKAEPGQRKDSEYAVIFEQRSLGLQLANVVRAPQPALASACAMSRGMEASAVPTSAPGPPAASRTYTRPRASACPAGGADGAVS